MPSDGGTYVLLCEAFAEARVTIGRLGILEAHPGWYAYVGSAFGPGGLSARVGRHMRREKPLRWHFDYLRPLLDLRSVWFSVSTERCEAVWARALTRLPAACVPLEGFGASDHRGASHLAAFDSKPSLLDFEAQLGALDVPCGQVTEWCLDESLGGG